MAEVWIGGGDSGTCAGAPVVGSAHMFSKELLRGCEYFAGKAKSSDDCEEILCTNTACILFSTSVLEAQINEWISISAQLKSDDDSAMFWKNLEGMQKSLKVDEKWNLIASYHNATLWDYSKEPFLSYRIITALRNELVHYKGTFLGKDEVPNKKIKVLMKIFKAETKAGFIGDDVSNWVSELLGKKDLGDWVYKKTKEFHNFFFNVLMEKP